MDEQAGLSWVHCFQCQTAHFTLLTMVDSTDRTQGLILTQRFATGTSTAAVTVSTTTQETLLCNASIKTTATTFLLSMQASAFSTLAPKGALSTHTLVTSTCPPVLGYPTFDKKPDRLLYAKSKRLPLYWRYLAWLHRLPRLGVPGRRGMGQLRNSCCTVGTFP